MFEDRMWCDEGLSNKNDRVREKHNSMKELERVC